MLQTFRATSARPCSAQELERHCSVSCLCEKECDANHSGNLELSEVGAGLEDSMHGTARQHFSEVPPTLEAYGLCSADLRWFLGEARSTSPCDNRGRVATGLPLWTYHRTFSHLLGAGAQRLAGRHRESQGNSKKLRLTTGDAGTATPEVLACVRASQPLAEHLHGFSTGCPVCKTVSLG